MSEPIPPPAGTAPPPAVPLQAHSLEYATARGHRPGLITAIGVISIVVASLTLLAGLWGALSYGSYLVMSGFSRTGGFAVATTPGGAGGVNPGTLNDEDFAAVIAALVAAQDVPPADIDRLNRALPHLHLPLNAPPQDTPWTQEFVAGQITSTTADSVLASVTWHTGSGSITLDPREISVSGWSGPDGSAAVAADGTVTLRTTNFVNPFENLPVWPSVAGAVSELLNVGVAVLLLVAGILVLRDSRRARPLHLWWAWLKLGAIVVTLGVGFWWAQAIWGNFASFGATVTTISPDGTSTTAQPAGGPALGGMGLIMFLPVLIPSVIAAIYPIAVLLVFRARTVREYYAYIDGEQGPAL